MNLDKYMNKYRISPLKTRKGIDNMRSSPPVDPVTVEEILHPKGVSMRIEKYPFGVKGIYMNRNVYKVNRSSETYGIVSVSTKGNIKNIPKTKYLELNADATSKPDLGMLPEGLKYLTLNGFKADLKNQTDLVFLETNRCKLKNVPCSITTFYGGTKGINFSKLPLLKYLVTSVNVKFPKTITRKNLPNLKTFVMYYSLSNYDGSEKKDPTPQWMIDENAAGTLLLYTYRTQPYLS